MSDEQPEPIQLWVRTAAGVVYGPLTPVSVELLLDNGVIHPPLQASLDGESYVPPGRLPGIRVVFPKETWGPQVPPSNGQDEAWAKVVPLAPFPSSTAPAVPSQGASGLPAPARARPEAGVVAGPGARAQASQRPLHPAHVGAANRSAPHAAPGIRPGPPPVLQASPPLEGSGPSPSRPTQQVRPPSRRSNPIIPPVGGDPSAETPTGVHAAPGSAGEITSSGSAGGPGWEPPKTPLPEKGALSEVSAPRLYYLAASQDFTGAMTAVLSDCAVEVHFRKGNPDRIDSTHPDDRLPQFLARQRLATLEQIAEADRAKGRFGGELLGALFGLGILNPGNAVATLGQRSANILRRLLLADRGTFSIRGGEVSSARSFPLGNKWGLFVEQLRAQSIPEVRRRLFEVLDLPILKSGGGVQAGDLRLTPQEARALTYFDGVRSLQQLVAEHPTETDVILRTAWMLQECELVSFAARPNRPGPAEAPPPPEPSQPPPPAKSARLEPGPEAVRPGSPPSSQPPRAVASSRPPAPAQGGAPRSPGQPAAAAAPRAAPAKAAPAPAQTVQAGPSPVRPPPVLNPTPLPQTPLRAEAPRDLGTLLELSEKLKLQNHFEVLELDRKATAATVKAAYFKLARHYHPDTVPPGAPAQLVEVKADIFARIGEAHRTLSDAALRAEYEAELDSGGTGDKVDVMQILAAEEFFQKGQLLVKARKFPEAIGLFDQAIAGHPDEGEYYAWRGFAKFFTHPDKKVGHQEAMKDISICLQRNPNAVPVWYFQGVMAKLLGDVEGAKRHFKTCVTLDPKHIDATRELRLFKAT